MLYNSQMCRHEITCKLILRFVCLYLSIIHSNHGLILFPCAFDRLQQTICQIPLQQECLREFEKRKNFE